MNLLILSLWLVLPDSSCVVCHSDLAGAYRESIHTRAAIGCTTCHGGVAGPLEENLAHRGLRKGSLDRLQVPRLCGGCHSDAEKMRPFGLPLDAFAYYQTSAHGRAWKRGQRDAAVCTDCHGVHEILSVRDPRSPVSRAHLVETCASCHADTARMKAFHLDPHIPQRYRESVHFRAASAGNTHAPVCTDCHGSHGAAPPGVRDVEQVCGRCHTREATAFDESPHKTAYIREGLAPCTSCHGEHDVQPLTLERLQETCTDCHDENDRGGRRAKELWSMLSETLARLRKAETLIQTMQDRGYPVEDLKGTLQDAREAWMVALPLVHTLNTDTLALALGQVRGRADDVQGELHERANRKKEGRVLLLVLWFYVLLTIGVIEARLRAEHPQREQTP